MSTDVRWSESINFERSNYWLGGGRDGIEHCDLRWSSCIGSACYQLLCDLLLDTRCGSFRSKCKWFAESKTKFEKKKYPHLNEFEHTHTNSEKEFKLIFENDLAVKFTQFTRFRHCVWVGDFNGHRINFHSKSFRIKMIIMGPLFSVLAIEVIACCWRFKPAKEIISAQFSTSSYAITRGTTDFIVIYWPNNRIQRPQEDSEEMVYVLILIVL